MSTATHTNEFAKGWPVILACALGVGLGVTGLAYYSMSLFIGPLGKEFGWTRTEISGATFALLLGTILTSPLVGSLIDKVGAVRLAMISMLAVAVGFVILAVNPGSLPLYYGTWLFISLVGTGTTPIIWTRTVNFWFNTHRGLALAITLCGTGVVAIIAPLSLNAIITAYGWRAAYGAVAAVIVVIGMPVIYAILAKRAGPEVAAPDAGLPKELAKVEGFTVAEAAATPAFWQMGIGILLIAMIVSGLIVHLVPMMVDMGIPIKQAAANMSMLGIAIIIGRLAIGALLDRFPARLVAFAVLLLPAVACAVLLGKMSPVVAVVLVGMSAGAEVDLLAYLVRTYYGMRRYAGIYGWMLSAFSLGAGLGPIFAGKLHDVNGNYAVALYSGAALAVVSAALFGTLSARRPAAALSGQPG